MSTAMKLFVGIWLLLCFCARCNWSHDSMPRQNPTGEPVPAPAAKPAPPDMPAVRPQAHSLKAGAEIHFVGEVNRGDRFVKKVPPNLVFRLNPYAEPASGWRIEILPDTVPLPDDFDCSGSVTPPAHGPNPVFLEGPDERTPEKTVWNPHEFNFVADGAACKIAWDLSLEEIYPSKLTDKEKEADEKKWGKIPMGTGTLKVLDSRLGSPSAADRRGAILWLKFEVTLQFPRQANRNR